MQALRSNLGEPDRLVDRSVVLAEQRSWTPMTNRGPK